MGYGDLWDPIGWEQKVVDEQNFADGYLGRSPRYTGQENHPMYIHGRIVSGRPSRWEDPLFKRDKDSDDLSFSY
jgi:hypothetical protein